jgi:hypothetical protein
MKVNVSPKTEAIAAERKIAITVLDEGVVHLYYYEGISSVVASTAKVLSSLKKDNPSLMVTDLEIVTTAVSKDGAIINFEEKTSLI